MASPTRSDFPKFLDGDVLIIISPSQVYKLHSQVLTTHSTVFAEQIAAQPAPRLNAQARRDNAAAYRFEFKRSSDEDQSGEFIRMEINEAGRVVGPSRNVVMPDLENGKGPDYSNRAWDWLFGVFYNREPVFDDSNLATVLSCVLSLVECAESIGAVEHVRDVVDLALMRQDDVLWTSILENPHVWIELGRRVRSPAIYREAAIHLIGQWGTIPDEEKDRVSQDIREILERKATELSLKKEALELRILGHYPEFIRRIAADKPGRPSYSGDIYMWMAVGFFRQWVAQNISDDRTRRAPDGGLNFYMSLHAGGHAYLNHMDFQEFHKYFPMSIKACHVLEANMGLLKEDIKAFVEDIMKQHTHLKREQHEIHWLTCATIEKEDMPWHIPDTNTKPNDALQSMYDDIEDEQALMQVRATLEGGGKRSGHDDSHTHARPKKRAKIHELDSASESDDDGGSSNDMFVREDGSDPMEE
ncbi:uncharacterized protein Z520_06241 [Fonsecaea multimorphosa CBS 102226]|uniref:BTB domain-containing protein n=1 Tax=Fonsecaea multimorphosa CBS 102226 TaxID=1442371 RepID=A0A0D2IMA2_9EURO|nr:uncharacterized protein Z520_06241 [Fonsecaea multimorphosa CBS 102226]KIX98161.1 hypothetical protein Z520_06241 [Fonsecaea multimorphosa CBS 102226]OAL24236.1 hypothetical protein AYO22_05896 [Fonsecaea multimorphosa]